MNANVTATATASSPRYQSNKTPPDARKLRGGYYTPSALADYLCKWAIRNPFERVVEPSCGDGSFVQAAAERLDETGGLTAVEVVEEEIEKAQARLNGARVPVDWRCDSFFRVMPELLQGKRFDAVVGNPPFIRFQHFDPQERSQAFSLGKMFGYRKNGLANAWTSFVALSAELLKDGGRLAMVVPAELLQVQYAADLRFRLPYLFRDVLVVAFDELVFPEIQQEVVLLLAEGRTRHAKTPGRLHTLQVRNGDDLPQAAAAEPQAVTHAPVGTSTDEMKWTSLFLDQRELQTLRDSCANPDLGVLESFASVDVGIVTGRNRFFVVDHEDAKRLQLGDRAVNIVGRTSALKSLRLTAEDWEGYERRHPSKLLDLNGWRESLFPAVLQDYLRDAEAHGVHQGYKCRIRKRWFDVPSVYVPDGFMHRQIHHAPLIAENLVGATATDTIHRVRVRPNVHIGQLCASMVNSLTFAWAEVVGRSYGGGVLELEPREAERLRVPYRFANDIDTDYVDGKLREGDIEAAADHGDRVLLRDGCGLSEDDVRRARAAWLRLRGRRHRRRQGG